MFRQTMFKKIVSALMSSAMVLAFLVALTTYHTPVLAATSEPELWAVIVGVTEYQCPSCMYDQEWNKYPVGIKYPDDDARDLAAQLEPIAGEDHIKVVLNDQATNSGIYYAVKWLAENAGPEDTAIFYFSGHSAPHYFGSYDYFVSDLQMGEWMDTVHAKKVVLIMDTCFSGSFRNELGTNGRVLLMSCQPFESSLEDTEFKNGVFTYYVLQALNDFSSTDINSNYELSAKEIFDYASPKTAEEIVQPYANQAANSDMQHPTFYISPTIFGEINLLMKVTVHSGANQNADSPILSIDGKSYLPKEVPASFTWLSGTSHVLEVPRYVNAGDGTRLAFSGWSDGVSSSSRSISRGGDYTAEYATQYELSFDSPYGDPRGHGWYDSGSSAYISVDPLSGGIIRHNFIGWSGDFTGQDTTATITMDKNKRIKVDWQNDYLRLILLMAAIAVVSGGIVAGIMWRRKNTQQEV